MRHWKGDSQRLVYACDGPWWDFHVADLISADLDAELWTQDAPSAEKYHLNHIRSVEQQNLSPRGSDFIHQGKNSGFQAINLAYLRGATTVLLLGYDMQPNGKNTHWFGPHPPQLNRFSSYDAFIKEYRTIDVPDLEIINCSRETALHFRRSSIDEALNDLRQRAKSG